jgi:hypothetical protein
MSKHTPGPWNIDTDGGVPASIHADIKAVCLLGYDNNTPTENWEPNAHLIAASPELLEALQKIVNNWGDLHPKDRQQARQAIAKAKGETNG